MMKREGIEVISLPSSDLRYASSHLADSYEVYSWLRSNTHGANVIHFVTSSTVPYFSTLSKHQGLAFKETALVVLAGEDSVSSSNSVADALELDFMRRQSLSYADVSVSPLVSVESAMYVDPHVFDPSTFFDKGYSRWVGFQQWLVQTIIPTLKPMQSHLKVSPLVSVCLVHRNRPNFLKHALASLEAQDYTHFEVILVDDGSDQSDAVEYLTSLEPQFLKHGWKILRQENKYLGAARNAAARHARGQYLLFMDDDNYAKPHEISTFVSVALATDVDVLTSFVHFFTGNDRPNHDDARKPPYMFLGGAPGIGALRNCFGDANSFVKRSVFLEIGGFTEDFGVGYEDWEFFAKAAMMGKQVQVVPEALYFYRFTPNSMQRGGTVKSQNRLRSLRPYTSGLTASLSELVTSDLVPRQKLPFRAFYDFYGGDFYDWTPSPSPTPVPIIIPTLPPTATPSGQVVIVFTLNVSCDAFNATVQALREWAALYLGVPIEAIQVNSNCPQALATVQGVMSVSSVTAAESEGNAEVTFYLVDVPPNGDPNSECANGCSAQALSKRLETANAVLTFPVLNAVIVNPPQPPPSSSSSSGVPVAAIVVPIVVVVAMAGLITALLVIRNRRRRGIEYRARMAAAFPSPNNLDVIYV
eukprot:CAMPEP_0184652948 /NCGR_PEP_ID=MMETSP0308-20130426/10663_1 /TAXON_ID=38269 /ORGANISM="Gloeochaete witrockiana, Strain SAG 46.84" /LENGTH=642 /DNA_ID=CAMNT_0027088129 /DNA_START=654 /DNA_END=2582 /DNA_ORIENTATION=+